MQVDSDFLPKITRMVLDFWEENGHKPDTILLPDDPVFQDELKTEIVDRYSGVKGKVSGGLFKVNNLLGIPVREYTGETIEFLRREDE